MFTFKKQSPEDALARAQTVVADALDSLDAAAAASLDEESRLAARKENLLAEVDRTNERMGTVRSLAQQARAIRGIIQGALGAG